LALPPHSIKTRRSDTWLRWLRVALIDLRGDLRRFTVLLACLALGVGTIAAVGSVGDAFRDAISRDARVILGGDLEARLADRPALAGELEFFRTLGQVSEVLEFSGRAISGDRTAFLSVRAGDENYPLVGSVTLGPEGAAPQPLAEVLAERDGRFGVALDPQLFERLGIAVGDTLQIGGATFQARASLVALPDKAVQGFQFGLPVVMSKAGAQATGSAEPGLLNRYRYKILLDGKNYDEARSAIRESFPDAGWIVRSPSDATAALSRFFTLFGRFLVLVGLSSLLVGGVGVSNAVSAYVIERQSTIATMRSMGATSGRILVHFLAQILLMSLCGIAIGLLLGAASTLLALPFLGGLLSLDLSPGVALGPLSVAAGFGILVAFAFAIIPLRRAQTLRPAWLFRAARGVADSPLGWRAFLRPALWGPLLLAVGGIAGLATLNTGQPWLVLWYAVGAFVAFLVLRIAGFLLQAVLRRLPPLPNTQLRLAVSSLTRPRAPAPTVILSLGLGLSLLLLIVLVDHNLRTQIRGEVAEQAPSFVALSMGRAERDALDAFVRSTTDVADYELTPSLRATITAVKGVAAEKLSGLPPEIATLFRGDTTITWARTLPEGSRITGGEWWAENYAGEPLVSLDEDLREPLGLTVGDTLDFTVIGRPVTARIASFRALDFAANGVSSPIVFSPGLIERAPARYTATIRAADGRDSALELAMARQLPDVTVLPVGEALDRAADIVGRISNAVGIIGGLAVLSGVLVLAGAMAVGRRQRDADAMVMKILGATRGAVVAAFVAEYALLGALSALMALGLGSVGAWLIVTRVLELPFAVDLPIAVAVVAGAVAATVLTGVLTTWSSLSVRPAAKLRASLG